MGEHDTLLNAVIGAAVAVFASFIPLSTLVGGAVAGYLESDRAGDGLRVGAISGLLQLVVGVVIGVVGLVFFSAVLFGAGGSGGLIGAGILFFLVVLVISAVYTVGLSALGGWIGSQLK